MQSLSCSSPVAIVPDRPLAPDAMPSSTGHPKSDPTVYTGLGGVAFMYFRLFLSFQATDAAHPDP